MNIVTLGSALCDIFIHYTNKETITLANDQKNTQFIALEEGKKTELSTLTYAIGGGAVNAAISFERLGFNPAIYAKIGDDADGKFILNRLTHTTVNTDLITISKKTPTGKSFIIPCPSGDRSVLVYRGANVTIEQKDIPMRAITQADAVYITSLSGKTAQLLPYIVSSARKAGIFIAVNPGTSQLQAGALALKQALPFIDVLILNAFEAQLLMSAFAQDAQSSQKSPTRSRQKAASSQKPSLLAHAIAYYEPCFTLVNFFHSALRHGPRIVAVTNGAEGVYVAHKEGILFHPSLPANIVNTLGAGDAFGSCFSASILQGYPLEESLRYGMLNSTSVISYLDAQTGLLTKDTLLQHHKGLKKNLLKRFTL
jgi:sugar/nucleoside kinase (ribokinase family)